MLNQKATLVLNDLHTSKCDLQKKKKRCLLGHSQSAQTRQGTHVLNRQALLLPRGAVWDQMIIISINHLMLRIVHSHYILLCTTGNDY